MNTVPYIETDDSLSFVIDSTPYTIHYTHPSYTELRVALRQGVEGDKILEMLDLGKRLLIWADGNLEVRDGAVLYDGKVINNTIADRILWMIEDGADFTPLANLLKNLSENPSDISVDEFYLWFQKGKMPITPDGCVLAYKWVRDNYYDYHSSTLRYMPGDVVEMPREKVDPDRYHTCSSGLHFCSYEYLPAYASGYGRCMIVKVNPRDIVSIPADHNDTKGRCCGMEVVAEYVGGYKSGPAFDTPVFDPEAIEDEYEYEEEEEEDEAPSIATVIIPPNAIGLLDPDKSMEEGKAVAIDVDGTGSSWAYQDAPIPTGHTEPKSTKPAPTSWLKAMIDRAAEKMKKGDV